MNGKLGVVYQQLLKTTNRKQQNTDNGLWVVENCDFMLEILRKHNPFERITGPDNCDVRVIFLWRFFTWPCYYYNDNKDFEVGCSTSCSVDNLMSTTLHFTVKCSTLCCNSKLLIWFKDFEADRNTSHYVDNMTFVFGIISNFFFCSQLIVLCDILMSCSVDNMTCILILNNM